jgi:hypothetical protein
MEFLSSGWAVALAGMLYCREKSEQLARLEEFPRDVLLRSLFEAAARTSARKKKTDITPLPKERGN